MILKFFIGLCLYSILVCVSYKSAEIKYPYAVVGVLGAAVNITWLSIASRLDHSQIYTTGFLWDGMIVLCYAVVPILLFGVKTTLQAAVGALFIVIGGILLKL